MYACFHAPNGKRLLATIMDKERGKVVIPGVLRPLTNWGQACQKMFELSGCKMSRQINPREYWSFNINGEDVMMCRIKETKYGCVRRTPLDPLEELYCEGCESRNAESDVCDMEDEPSDSNRSKSKQYRSNHKATCNSERSGNHRGNRRDNCRDNHERSDNRSGNRRDNRERNDTIEHGSKHTWKRTLTSARNDVSISDDAHNETNNECDADIPHTVESIANENDDDLVEDASIPNMMKRVTLKMKDRDETDQKAQYKKPKSKKDFHIDAIEYLVDEDEEDTFEWTPNEDKWTTDALEEFLMRFPEHAPRLIRFGNVYKRVMVATAFCNPVCDCVFEHPVSGKEMSVGVSSTVLYRVKAYEDATRAHFSDNT